MNTANDDKQFASEEADDVIKPGVYTLTCVICGKMFSGRAHNVTVCGDACLAERMKRDSRRAWHAAWDAMTEAERDAYRAHKRARLAAVRATAEPRADRTCIVCGTSFRPRNRLQRCCSHACTVRHSRACTQERDAKARQERQARGGVQKTCIVCGKTFAARTKLRRMCSDACAAVRKAQTQQALRAAKRLARPARRQDRACVVCGGTFTGTKNQTCCSTACAHRARQRGAAATLAARAQKRALSQSVIGDREMTLKRSGPHTCTTRRCAVCNALVEKDTMKNGCCSDACVTALAKRVTVRCLSSRVAVGERVLVSHCETRTLSGGEHLVQVSDAGVVVSIRDGQARIGFAGRIITASVADIATTKSIVERVRESMGDSSYDKQLRRQWLERRKNQSISS